MAASTKQVVPATAPAAPAVLTGTTAGDRVSLTWAPSLLFLGLQDSNKPKQFAQMQGRVGHIRV